MTAVANEVFAASQFNINVRDNMLETAPAKATTAGRWFQSETMNQLVERSMATASVATSQTTTSLSYTDLTTVGPSVTITTGYRALVFIGARSMHSSVTAAGEHAKVSYAVSGATTIAASDTWSSYRAATTSNNNRNPIVHLTSALNPGSNTFTLKYKVSAAGTGTFDNRSITVVAL